MADRCCRIPIAREGWPFIAPPLVLAILSALAGGWFITVPLGLIGLFCLWFFRDPERRTPEDALGVIAPADGVVIKSEEVDESRFLNRRMKKVSIFMNVFNVHVNRAPVSGKVEQVHYFPGKFLVASLDKASTDNEHNAVVMKPEGRDPIVVVQIAGLIARRIVCWVKAGDAVQKGERFGLIRFGSRLDVYLPPEVDILVQIGQKTTAGETVLARFKQTGD